MACLQRHICNGVCTMPVQIVTQWPAIFVVCVCGINTLLRGSAAEYFSNTIGSSPLALTHWTVPLPSALTVRLPWPWKVCWYGNSLNSARGTSGGFHIFLYMKTLLFSIFHTLLLYSRTVHTLYSLVLNLGRRPPPCGLLARQDLFGGAQWPQCAVYFTPRFPTRCTK